ncbi:unnamed protein product [Symbiodinium natans]|uniref:Uncharacterized protein n=1 Tax=Symbiodinium natans TaxID=878477 RepID=A0A812RTK4_9DINO|nr:unnamed protein product [Symbiodinium natans]
MAEETPGSQPPRRATEGRCSTSPAVMEMSPCLQDLLLTEQHPCVTLLLAKVQSPLSHLRVRTRAGQVEPSHAKTALALNVRYRGRTLPIPAWPDHGETRKVQSCTCPAPTEPSLRARLLLPASPNQVGTGCEVAGMGPEQQSPTLAEPGQLWSILAKTEPGLNVNCQGLMMRARDMQRLSTTATIRDWPCQVQTKTSPNEMCRRLATASQSKQDAAKTATN